MIQTREVRPLDTFRILHISDLHFGFTDQQPVWGSFVNFINGDDERKPSLILVTGDLADTPSKKLYAAAATGLGGIQLRNGSPDYSFLVCPGNHDRHPKGNTARILRKPLDWFFPSEGFSSAFQNRIPGLDTRYRIPLGPMQNRWNLLVMGVDSSIDASYFAQGFLRVDELDKAFDATRQTANVDLVILMIHHHLLPIPLTERAGSHLADNFQPTIIGNAGVVLESICRANIDLVLHGHEHARNLARYGSVREEGAETVVLGAGSATGVVTFENTCMSSRAHANLIELRPDRSVWLREITNDGVQWRLSTEPVELLSNYAVRRARFSRRSDRKSPATSELVKHVVVTAHRDAIIREERSDWLIKGGSWTVIARNRTGTLIGPELEVPKQFAEGMKVSRFQPWQKEDHAYIANVEFNTTQPLLLPLIKVQYQWLDAIVLTKQDLQLYDKATLGPFRRDECEFIASTVDNFVHSLTLTVALPKEFAPEPEKVSVYFQDTSDLNKEPEYSHSLTKRLIANREGLFVLTVPYPLQGYRYAIVWPLADVARGRSSARLTSVVERNGDELAKAFFSGLADMAWAKFAQVALYVPRVAASPMLELAGRWPAQGDGTPLPTLIALKSSKGFYLHAWWGEAGYAIAEYPGGQLEEEAKEAGMVNGERVLVTAPVRVEGQDPTEPPLAILRLGIRQSSELTDKQDYQQIAEKLDAAVAESRTFMLNKLIELNRATNEGHIAQSQ